MIMKRVMNVIDIVGTIHLQILMNVLLSFVPVSSFKPDLKIGSTSIILFWSEFLISPPVVMD